MYNPKNNTRFMYVELFITRTKIYVNKYMKLVLNFSFKTVLGSSISLILVLYFAVKIVAKTDTNINPLINPGITTIEDKKYIIKYILIVFIKHLAKLLQCPPPSLILTPKINTVIMQNSGNLLSIRDIKSMIINLIPSPIRISNPYLILSR